MDIFNVLTMIGGLCLFLFGMNLMGQALERRAGGKLQSLLDKMTGSVPAGFLTGLGITAIIQSSSATTVMVVGFVNSGLMTLRQAINVIMGANVGTTVTAWLLSLAGISGSNIEALKQYVNMRLNSNGEPENLTRLDIRSENGKFTVDASGEGKVEKILYGGSETVPTAPGTYPVTCVVRLGSETITYQIGTLIVPEPPAEAAQPAPVYHVTDKDGNQIPYTAAREGGVLTIRVDAAYARLTLTADEAQALTAQGVEKVVFITTGATSAFRPADLTAYASEAPFVLTHDGETVTFTAGETDLASLLLQA